MLSEVSGERYLCGVTGKKGRKPVDELTREQGAAQCSYAAWNLVPLSPCPLVNLLTRQLSLITEKKRINPANGIH